ncbi:MAG: transposase [bacterium]|nr:transposase [bacterium]
MSGVDFTTFIKFREKIKQQCWLDNVFTIVAKSVVKTRKSLTLITDSSFVEQYARHKETGAEYSGHKEKTGFKLHQIIDFRTRLPMAQVTTGGARADVILAQQLVQKLPKRWPVKSFLADKGYDSNAFAQQLHHKWFGIKVGIPVRRTGQAARKSKRQETPLNRQAKEANRCLDLKLYNKRTEVERYFSRKKYVFNLGCERTCGIDNFDTNCLMTSVMEQLEYLARPGLG